MNGTRTDFFGKSGESGATQKAGRVTFIIEINWGTPGTLMILFSFVAVGGRGLFIIGGSFERFFFYDLSFFWKYFFSVILV